MAPFRTIRPARAFRAFQPTCQRTEPVFEARPRTGSGSLSRRPREGARSSSLRQHFDRTRRRASSTSSVRLSIWSSKYPEGYPSNPRTFLSNTKSNPPPNSTHASSAKPLRSLEYSAADEPDSPEGSSSSSRNRDTRERGATPKSRHAPEPGDGSEIKDPTVPREQPSEPRRTPTVARSRRGRPNARSSPTTIPPEGRTAVRRLRRLGRCIEEIADE